MSLVDVLKAQKQAVFQNQTELDEDMCSYLVFNYQDGLFGVDLSYVREVVEFREYKPYPIAIKGHLGIINIRSKILPVLAPVQLTDGTKPIQGDKVLLLEFAFEQAICLIVKSVQKVLIPGRECEVGNTINLKGQPVKLIDQFIITGGDAEDGYVGKSVSQI